MWLYSGSARHLFNFWFRKKYWFPILLFNFSPHVLHISFFGKNPTTRIKKNSKKAYKNSKKFSAILGLVFLFLGLVDMITSPKSGSNFLYLDTGLIFLLLPE